MSRRTRGQTAEVKEQRAEILKRNVDAGITGATYRTRFKNKKARELGLITIDDIDYRVYDWDGDKEGATGDIIREDTFAPVGQLRIIGGRPIIEWEDKDEWDDHRGRRSGVADYDPITIEALEEEYKPEEEEDKPDPEAERDERVARFLAEAEAAGTRGFPTPPIEEEEEEAAPTPEQLAIQDLRQAERLTERDVELFRDTPKYTRNRERVEGSWRQQERGKCYTRTNKNGGAYVVCEEGSRGQKGVYQPTDREDREDPDQKGRSKTQAIKKNRTVLRKYDDDGKIIEESEAQYFVPLKRDGGNVLLYPADKGGMRKLFSGRSTELNKRTIAKLTKDAISIPLQEFNAQYRATRGLNEVGDDHDDLEAGEYEIGEEDAEKRAKNLARDKKVRKARRERDKLAKAEKEIFEEVGGRGRAGFREAIVKRGAARRIRQSPAAVQRRKDIREIIEAAATKRRGYEPGVFGFVETLERLGYTGRGEDEYEDLDIAIGDIDAGRLFE